MTETLQERISWLLMRSEMEVFKAGHLGAFERFKEARREPGKRGELARGVEGPGEARRWLEDSELGPDNAVLEALLESSTPKIKLTAAEFAPTPLAVKALRDVLAPQDLVSSGGTRVERVSLDFSDSAYGKEEAVVRLLRQRSADVAPCLDAQDIALIDALEPVGRDNVVLALVARMAGSPEMLERIVSNGLPLESRAILDVANIGGGALSRFVPYEEMVTQLNEPRGGIRGAGEWEEAWDMTLAASRLPWKGVDKSLRWLPKEEICARLSGAIGNMFASGHVQALCSRAATQEYLTEEDYTSIALALRGQWLARPVDRRPVTRSSARRESQTHPNVRAAVQTLFLEGVTPYWRTLAGVALVRQGPKRLEHVLRVRQEFQNLTGVAPEPLLLDTDALSELSSHSDGRVRAAFVLAVEGIQIVPTIDEQTPTSSQFMAAGSARPSVDIGHESRLIHFILGAALKQ